MNKLFSIILLVAAGLAAGSCSNSSSSPSEAVNAVPVDVYQVNGQRVSYYESYPATMVALKEVQLRSQVSGYIQPGQHVKILEGPDCTDYWNWWRVTVEESGATGWAAEGNDTETWLFPVK